MPLYNCLLGGGCRDTYLGSEPSLIGLWRSLACGAHMPAPSNFRLQHTVARPATTGQQNILALDPAAWGKGAYFLPN
jgi:hypothetical protein